MKASKQELEALSGRIGVARRHIRQYAEARAAAADNLQRAHTEYKCLRIKQARAITGKTEGDLINTIGGRGKIDSITLNVLHQAEFNVFLTKKNGDPYKVTRAFFISEVLPDD